MLLLVLLACADPADDTGSRPTDDTADTAPDAPACPGWSGLRPGVTRTLVTTAAWTAQTSAVATWTETTVQDGDDFVYSRTIEGTSEDAAFWYLNTATYRCDADGAWLLSETYDSDVRPVDGEPSTLSAAWTWTSDFLYFPTDLEVGMSVDAAETYDMNGSQRTLEATLTVYGRPDLDTVIGTLSVWDVELWDAGRASFADPEGRVATYAYELAAYGEEPSP